MNRGLNALRTEFENEADELAYYRRMMGLLKTTGIDVVLEERRHQIEDEGFDLENDRACVNDELVNAAMWFLSGDISHSPWPTSRHHPGKKGRINDLGKAAAFIAAEIVRLRDEEQRLLNDEYHFGPMAETVRQIRSICDFEAERTRQAG